MANIKCVICGGSVEDIYNKGEVSDDAHYSNSIDGWVCIDCYLHHQMVPVRPTREVLEAAKAASAKKRIHDISERMIAFDRVKDEILAAAKWVAMHQGRGLPRELSAKAVDFVNKYPEKFEKLVKKAMPKSNPAYIKRPKELKGGLGERHFSTQFDKKQLKRGIQVELEHTRDRRIAKMIAMDHLTEIRDYYTRLDKMEKQAKKLQKFRKNPESELDIAIQKLREWAESKAARSSNAAICLGYIEKIPSAIQEGPHLGFTASWALAHQLAYAISNSTGWRGDEARKCKATISKWIEAQRQDI